MTDRTSGQHRTVTKLENALRWVNVSGESIPAYGVVQLRTNYSAGNSQASKPNGTVGLFFANGAGVVAATKSGESLLWSRPQLVLVTGSPIVGDSVGPVSGSWAMSADGSGFCVIHQPVGGVAAVVQVGGGGGSSGGGHTIWFTIDDVLCPETDYTSETTLVAIPTYYNQGCDAIPPGAEYDGTYLVYDICNYLSGLTPADMYMTTGRATYMYPMTGGCHPKWIIDDLCAQPECI